MTPKSTSVNPERAELLMRLQLTHQAVKQYEMLAREARKNRAAALLDFVHNGVSMADAAAVMGMSRASVREIIVGVMANQKSAS